MGCLYAIYTVKSVSRKFENETYTQLSEVHSKCVLSLCLTIINKFGWIKTSTEYYSYNSRYCLCSRTCTIINNSCVCMFMHESKLYLLCIETTKILCG